MFTKSGEIAKRNSYGTEDDPEGCEVVEWFLVGEGVIRGEYMHLSLEIVYR